MGAWGAEPFDNDDAAGWSAEFDGVDGLTGLQLLSDAPRAADISDYLESPAVATAVASAQVVGWLLVPDAMQETPYRESVVAWVRSSAPDIPGPCARR